MGSFIEKTTWLPLTSEDGEGTARSSVSELWGWVLLYTNRTRYGGDNDDLIAKMWMSPQLTFWASFWLYKPKHSTSEDWVCTAGSGIPNLWGNVHVAEQRRRFGADIDDFIGRFWILAKHVFQSSFCLYLRKHSTSADWVCMAGSDIPNLWGNVNVAEHRRRYRGEIAFFLRWNDMTSRIWWETGPHFTMRLCTIHQEHNMNSFCLHKWISSCVGVGK